MTGPLEPGEMRLGPTLICPDHGEAQIFERIGTSGERDYGLLVRSDHPDVIASSSEYIELGEPIRPGVRRIKTSIRYTARGPARVSSNAYRSGWDAVFGQKRREPCRDESN